MIAFFMATAAFGGTGCNVGYAPAGFNYGRSAVTYNTVAKAAYVAPTTYHATTYQASSYTPVYQVSYRSAYAGIPVANPESQQQLLIIEQQSKALQKALENEQRRSASQEELIERLHQENKALLQSGVGVDGEPQPARGLSGGGEAVLQDKCMQCHSGAQGEKNGFVLTPDRILHPDLKTKVRVNMAVTRAKNPMPKGSQLTEQEMAALAKWWTPTPKDLEEGPPAKKQG